MEHLNTFIDQHPQIRLTTPASLDYGDVREAYIDHSERVPLAIVRPQTEDDGSALVKFCTAHAIPFTVRSGGHDPFGRHHANNAIAIDMRAINHVSINKDDMTATFGGGTLSSTLAENLAEKGLVAPMGSNGMIGWVGWATHGGYGGFGSNYGIGVDSILSARVINAEGEIVEADEDSEMLVGIRGGGGCLGIVVEMTIKVAKLEKILAGTILYESSDLSKTVTTVNTAYQTLSTAGRLPQALGAHRVLLNVPGLGRTFGLFFVWSSPDMAEGRRACDQIASFFPTVHNDVHEQTIPEWQAAGKANLPYPVYGTDSIVMLHHLTDATTAAIAKHCALMPDDPITLVSIHELRSDSISCTNKSLASRSVFPNRIPHLLVEFIAGSSVRERVEEIWAWAMAFKAELEDVARREGVLLERKYVSLVEPEELDPRVVFREKWEVLRGLKRRFDPGNVFGTMAFVKFGKEDLR